MALQNSSKTGVPVRQVSIVLDSGIFLSDAAVSHEDFSEVGYFLPSIVAYGDYAEIYSNDLSDSPSMSRMIHIQHFDSANNELRDGVNYSDDFLATLLRRKELYDGAPPEIIPSRFDWIFRFQSGHFRASSVKERVFKEMEGLTHQLSGNRKALRPIAHDVVVHYELGPDEYLVISNDELKPWSTADYPNIQKRFDIEIVAPHRTAENYFRDALNHNGRNYWLPNQGDPDPMGRP